MPSSVRILLNVACQFSLECLQGDVSTAYLRAPMDTVVYMAPPKGCDLEMVNGKRQCFLVKMSIYGTKQGGRNWYMGVYAYLKGSLPNRLHSRYFFTLLASENFTMSNGSGPIISDFDQYMGQVPQWL